MKKRAVMSLILGVTTAGAAMICGGTANASDDIIYGTMDIPYGEFFAAVEVDHEVDAVSSATTSKWNNMNLVNGTYSAANEDGTGTILGVKYYVALTDDTLAALGDNNYNFTKIDTVPAAYKTVSVEDGKAVFSKITGDVTEEKDEREITISTEMVWGDYVIDVKSINNKEGTSDFGTIYGVIVNTTDGSSYAMRHLQNIWRDEIAWSSGFKTTEPHGNTLDYEDYESIMGKTINEIVYITDTGYHSLSTKLYVPVKFENTVAVEGVDITSDTTDSTVFTAEGFPEDYEKTYSVNAENFTASEGRIDFTEALPGSYTLTISDANGKYADVNTAFLLSSKNIPVAFDGEKLTAADGFSEEEAKQFLKNITTVSVDESSYAASGKKSIKFFDEEGNLDLTAASGDTEIFAEDKEYSVAVTATGYENAYEFTVVKGAAEESSEPEESSKTEESSVPEESSETSAAKSSEETSAESSIENSTVSAVSGTESSVESSADTSTASSQSSTASTTSTTKGTTTGTTTTSVNTTSSAATNSSVPSTGASETAAAAALAVAAVSAGIAVAFRRKKSENV